MEVEGLFGGWGISVSWVENFGVFKFDVGNLDCDGYCFWVESGV